MSVIPHKMNGFVKIIAVMLCPLLALAAGCATQEKRVMEAASTDFETVWVGYGAGGNYFYRLAITNGGGDAVLVYQYDNTCRRYRVESLSVDLKRWTFSTDLIPQEERNAKIRLCGRLLSRELECEARGPDWVYEVRLVREDLFLRNMQIAMGERGVSPQKRNKDVVRERRGRLQNKD